MAQPVLILPNSVQSSVTIGVTSRPGETDLNIEVSVSINGTNLVQFTVMKTIRVTLITG